MYLGSDSAWDIAVERACRMRPKSTLALGASPLLHRPASLRGQRSHTRAEQPQHPRSVEVGLVLNENDPSSIAEYYQTRRASRI